VKNLKTFWPSNKTSFNTKNVLCNLQPRNFIKSEIWLMTLCYKYRMSTNWISKCCITISCFSFYSFILWRFGALLLVPNLAFFQVSEHIFLLRATEQSSAILCPRSVLSYSSRRCSILHFHPFNVGSALPSIFLNTFYCISCTTFCPNCFIALTISWVYPENDLSDLICYASNIILSLLSRIHVSNLNIEDSPLLT
jgi:hypothetical protein